MTSDERSIYLIRLVLGRSPIARACFERLLKPTLVRCTMCEGRRHTYRLKSTSSGPVVLVDCPQCELIGDPPKPSGYMIK